MKKKETMYSLSEDSLGNGKTTSGELGAPHIGPHELHLLTILSRTTVGGESAGHEAHDKEQSNHDGWLVLSNLQHTRRRHVETPQKRPLGHVN